MNLTQAFVFLIKVTLYFVSGVCAAVLVAGCASPLFKERDLTEKAAYALWLPKDCVSVSDIRFSLRRVDYVVETSSGSVYDCYLTGVFTLSGRAISDASCQAK